MTELRQCKEYGEYLKEVVWEVEKHGKFQAFVRTIPFTPISVMKIQRVSIKDLDWDWIRMISKKHKVMVNYIELGESIRVKVGDVSKVVEVVDGNIMTKQGYRAIKNGMLPTKTQVLDLRHKIEDLRLNFKAKTRYNLGLTERKSLATEIKTGKELLEDEAYRVAFVKIVQENAKRVGYWATPTNWIEAKFKAFRDKCFVVFVKNNEEILAVALFLCTDTTCFYSLNGSVLLGRKLFAPTVAVWAAIIEAKQRKLRELDFDGVYDERYPNKRWLGYTRFKAGFSGDYVYYPPALVKWLPAR